MNICFQAVCAGGTDGNAINVQYDQKILFTGGSAAETPDYRAGFFLKAVRP